MEPPRDFCELLECFNANNVRHVIVGAYALGFHGAPRMTGDLDLLVQPSAENAKRIIDALAAFGFGGVGLSANDFQEPDMIIQLGAPPVRVDLLTGISGVSWEEAWDGRTPVSSEAFPWPLSVSPSCAETNWPLVGTGI